MPILSLAILLMVWISPSLYTLFIALTLLPAVHYSINSPAREILFIPTVKEIQFESKAWIDSFGRILSKTSGSTVGILFYNAGLPLFLVFNTAFSLVLISFWSIAAYCMGKSCQETIDKKAVISPFYLIILNHLIPQIF